MFAFFFLFISFGEVKNVVLGNVSISFNNTQHTACKSSEKMMDNSYKPRVAQRTEAS